MRRQLTVACALLISSCGLAFAQVPIGALPFGSFSGGGIETINNANLNVQLSIPVVSKPGRGMPFYFNLGYNSSVWRNAVVNGVLTWTPVGNWGWQTSTNAVAGNYTYVIGSGLCPGTSKGEGYFYTTYSNWKYYDPSGAYHNFPTLKVYDYSICPYGGGSGPFSQTATATDNSGYTLYVDAWPSAVAYPPSGISLYPAAPYCCGTNPEILDTNGNRITTDGTTFTDTLGMTTLSISGSTYTYTAAGNHAEHVSVLGQNFYIQTNFGCSGVSEYNGSANLVTEIDLPDSTKYTLTYESTPGHPGYVTGRLASITLPTGGTIGYLYQGSNNGINCSDGSTPQLQRTLSGPNVTTGTWTFARAQVSGTEWKTTVTDPQNNQTVIYFQGPLNAAGPNCIYETERQIYQGSTSGTLLKTVDTCYNDAPIPCTGTTITLPISKRAVQTTLPGLSPSKVYVTYNSYSLPTEVDEYDYGLALVRKTVTSYAPCFGDTYICDRPSSIQIQNSSGGLVSQRSFTYDAGGNALTVSYSGQNMGTLTRRFAYGGGGVLTSTTDFNGAITTFGYGTCNNTTGFPTSITLPVNNLSRSMVWDCYAGVMTSVTDENGKITSYQNNDPFSRPTLVSDPMPATTNIAYTGTTAQSTLNFNGGVSTVGGLVTVDALARAYIRQQQQAQGSANYDSVEMTHDALGRLYQVSTPYSAAGGGTCSTCTWAQTYTYDALGRTTRVSFAGGGWVNFTYSANDVLRQLVDPSVRAQYQYDALGRLTSVCEITGGSGSGPCSQNTAATGYFTSYGYDVLNDLTSVSQSGQGRTHQFDGMGRLTSETNPESGTTNYTYDSDPTCGTYSGDLVKRVDAVGNVTCYGYDGLHRVTSITYPSGNYAGVTPPKYFVYDSATVNGVVMANAKARLAEACTGGSGACAGSKTTDVGFSYSARGEIKDVYQSTSHSGGYYHVAGTYWENGLLNTLAGVGLPTLTYTPEGEGRVSYVTASSGQSPIPSSTPVLYNLFGNPPTLKNTYGSGDSDTFTLDSNTGRITQYNFNVSGSSVVGNLTWNTNGSLYRLAITDPFNSANAQTCTYGYDDLARIASANCGATIWNQSFSFDPFSNISKTGLGGGAESFQPSYSTATNRVTSLGGLTPTYDANGNLTYDTLHHYGWDAEGKPVTVDSIGLTFDALGRMVEQNRSGSYTQIVYGLTGGKLALMNAQTLSKAFAPLPLGAAAVYNSSGLAYYRHPDWLGSSRFASLPTGTNRLYYDGAYAPYGEDYAETGTQDRSFTAQNQHTINSGPYPLYDFLMREYHPTWGRWLSPDPAGLAAASPGNPQSWNRYAYVVNNPLIFTDPLGLEPSNNPSPGPGCVYEEGWGWLCPPVPGSGGGQQPCGPASLFRSAFGGGLHGEVQPCGGTSPGSVGGGHLANLPGPNISKLLSLVPPPCPVTAASIDTYLAGKGSPLEGQGAALLQAGQRYDVDPRLVVAIAGAESSFGRNITRGQYNAWNWLYNGPGNDAPFSSWAAGIQAVTRGLGGPNYLGNESGYYSGTSTLYPGHYCEGWDCYTNGIGNLNDSLQEQGGNIYNLTFPCGGGE